MIISLPWPDPRLSPNSRAHWAQVAKAKKCARAASHALTLALGDIDDRRHHFAGDFGIPVRVLFYPPDKRQRDADNAFASMKATFDGIADALKVNDSRFVPHMEMREPAKPGRVEILL